METANIKAVSRQEHHDQKGTDVENIGIANSGDENILFLIGSLWNADSLSIVTFCFCTLPDAKLLTSLVRLTFSS